MKQSEAKNLFIEYTDSQFQEWGFNLKKTKNVSAIYIRNKKENGYEDIGVSTTNYYPEVVFEMGTSKRINIVEEILYKINESYNLSLKLDQNEWTMAYFGERGKRTLALLEVEHKDDERGVQTSTKILMDYIANEVLPAYDLYDDLRELDKTINGEGENFWEDDIGTSKPFNFGGHFFARRLIIAKLCNNPRFEIIADRYFTYLEIAMEKQTGQPYHFDRNDLSLPVPATIKYLKENVSPIY